MGGVSKIHNYYIDPGILKYAFVAGVFSLLYIYITRHIRELQKDEWELEDDDINHIVRKKKVIEFWVLSDGEAASITGTQLLGLWYCKTEYSTWPWFYTVIYNILFLYIFLVFVYSILTWGWGWDESNYDVNITRTISIWIYIAMFGLAFAYTFFTTFLWFEFVYIMLVMIFFKRLERSGLSREKCKEIRYEYIIWNRFALVFYFFMCWGVYRMTGSLDFLHMLFRSLYITKVGWFMLFIAVFIKLNIFSICILRHNLHEHVSPFFWIFFSIFMFIFNGVAYFFIFLKLVPIIFTFRMILMKFVWVTYFITFIRLCFVNSYLQCLPLLVINVWTIIFLCFGYF